MGIVLNPELERRIARKIESGEFSSADEVIAKSLDLLEARGTAAPEAEARPSNGRPIWEVVAELGRSIPDEAWANVPSDLSKNVDHYLYGAPKESE